MDADTAKIIAAIRRLDELRRTGTNVLKAHRIVLAETGIKLKGLKFGPYRELMANEGRR